MRAFLSVAQVKKRLRIDNDNEDDDIQAMILSSTSVILNYLKNQTLYQDSNGDVLVDSNGDVIVSQPPNHAGVPAEVMLSTALLVGLMYRDRDGEEMASWEQGYLPWFISAPMYQLRDPACG